MNIYGATLFRSLALETLHDIHISDEKKMFLFLKEIKME